MSDKSSILEAGTATRGNTDMQLKLEQDVLQSVGEKGKAVEAKHSELPRGRNKTCVGQRLINKPWGL